MKKTLKFLSWMFILLLTVSVSSCKDDDEGHPFAGTVWEYQDVFTDGTVTERIRFIDETNAYYDKETRNAGGTIINNESLPYSYTFSNSLVIFKPLQAGKANLEGTIVEGVKMVLINTTKPKDEQEIGIFYKK